MDRSTMILLQITLCLTVLVVETYSSISWKTEILHRTKRQAECKPDEFKCTSGECIDIVSMCDGTKKCADGSDDTELTCKQLNITDSPSPSEGGCRLPQPPEFGAYTSPDCQTGEKTAACRQLTGTPVPQNWLLSFKCNEGYSHKETQDANIYVICVDGKWSPKIPICRKMCSPLVSSLTVDTRCVIKGGEVDCTKPMRPGTRATVQCKPSYITTSPYTHKEIFCTDKGQWSGELLYCEPACGRRNWKGVNTPLVAYGSAAKHGEFPWHVGVYEGFLLASNQWDLECGGSLISPHIVVTAAYCVSSWEGKPDAPETIKVGLGKYYRDWNHYEPYAVLADVREVLIPPGYTGYGYVQDIALLDLTRSVQLHAGIMPVCVDWKREFTITPGALGTLAGWGYTEHRTPSDVLLSVDLPYVDHSHCINQLPEEHQRLVTSDKFCGGYTNGTGAGWRDEGGGLTFVQDDLYYVYGIASNRVPYGNNRSVTTFTNITNEDVFTWLISSKNKFDKEHDEEYAENSSGGCLLPQPPEFGAYTSPDCQTGEKTAACRQLTGTPVPQNWLLSFKCNEGYSLKESQDANIYVICVDGKWSPKIPVCRIMCSPLASLSLDTRCVNKGGEVDCGKQMLPGTRATVQCKPSYTTTSPYPYKEIFCTDKGQWSGELLYCEPACGRRNWKGVNTPLIAHASAAKHGEFPWHVGVYWRNSSNQWEYRCGGSLISPHIVVTAAFWVSELPPEYIKVGLGKYYRDWYHDEPYAVQADVREVLIPPGYNESDGWETGYQQNIALLDLTRSVQLNASIMPVCVDWKREFTIPPGALGTLAGWGYTEHRTPSDVLLSVDLPYIDRSQCISQVPEEDQRFVTLDRFCAGYFNGTSTGAGYGDDGGGLMFVQDDLYYVYGIASSRLWYGNIKITTFTNITNEEIFTWLISSKNKLDEEYPENSSGGCRLPQPPEFGAYTSPVCQIGNNKAACRQQPGTPVPQNWLLSFKCNEGYYLKESQDANIYVICVDGKWSPKIQICRKMCWPLVALSLDTRCVNKGGEVDCTKPMLPGTRATVQCKPSYITTSPYRDKEIFCTDKGQWSGELFYCEKACGRRNWKGVNTPLIAHGSAAKHGEFPWHVGLYRRNSSNQWDLKCGGSLISPHFVVTAASCVFLERVQKPVDPETIKVGLGKYYREWTHYEPYAVLADVRIILIPPRYYGQATSYLQNIALLYLTHSVQLHAGIMPVCIDWQQEFTITPGALGTLAGWGATEHGTHSDVLLLVDFPYVDHSHCIHQVPEEYQHYVSSDRFCAGYGNGTRAGRWDNGGGLTFVQDDLYYVYGIASFGVPYGNGSITTFTNITNEEILNWLISSKNKLDEEYPEKCPPTSFHCGNGVCIDGTKRCNKEIDCTDGSDEAAPEFSAATATTEVPVPVPVPLKCKETEFKCTSGQCIDKFSVCDSRVDCPDKSDETESQCSSVSPSILSPKGGGCLLPQQPEFGAYTGVLCAFKNGTATCRQGSGTLVNEGWALTFKCSEGYYIKDESPYVWCVSGQWSPKIPACRKMCSSLISLSVAVRCFYGESDVDCSKPMRPGTRAKGECKPSYNQIRPPPYREIICRDDGQWSDELFYCQPACGRRNWKGVNTPQIRHGFPAKHGEFPWHVGLYYRNGSNQWEQRCGGSLISPHIILTAAHCVFSEMIYKKLPPEAIKVGLGKYHREWTHNETHAVKADVREILITPRYYGQITSYSQDIALLDLTHSVQLHAGIMPVCIDWQREFTITPGMLGTLAGWGKTENETFSDVLLYANFPYIDHHSCVFKVPQPFRHYVTTDKFCAGYTNGTGAANGDSGGGLTFVHDDLHYLHGVVSTKVKDVNSFITFTDISNVELFMWLNDAKSSLDVAHPVT